MCADCGKKYTYNKNCISCYARWICDTYKTPEARRSAIECCKHHAVDDLKAAVKREFERRKR